jgi:hypothetical protein
MKSASKKNINIRWTVKHEGRYMKSASKKKKKYFGMMDNETWGPIHGIGQ